MNAVYHYGYNMSTQGSDQGELASKTLLFRIEWGTSERASFDISERNMFSSQ